MCRKCGNPIEVEQIFRSSVCPVCGADLHSCINCRFYSPDSHYGCNETVDELVKDKEKANFCGSYSVARHPAVSPDASIEKAHVSAAALFSMEEAQVKSQTAASARSAFNSLFGN